MQEELRDQLIQAAQTLRKSRPAIYQHFGLPCGEFFMLHHIERLLQESPCGVQVSFLHQKTNMSMSAVSQLLRSLEKKDLILRTISPKDRRVILVTLTDKGQKICKNSHEEFKNYMSELISRFGEEKTRTLIALLKDLDVALEEMKSIYDCKNS